MTNRQPVYGRFLDGIIEGFSRLGEAAKRNKKREDFYQSIKYHSSRALLAAGIYPYMGLCKLLGFRFDDSRA